MRGNSMIHCRYCASLIAETSNVCPVCRKVAPYPARVKKRVMKNRKVSPKAYILFIIILLLVTTTGAFMVFNAIESGNALAAFILVCTIAIVITFLIHLVDQKPREYSYFM